MPDAVADAVTLLQTRRREIVAEMERIDNALTALGVEPKRAGRIVSALAEAAVTMSIRDQILNLMTEDRTYTAEEVVEALEGNPASIRSILSRMARAGDLESTGRGTYARAGHFDDLFSGSDDDDVAAADHDLQPQEDGG